MVAVNVLRGTHVGWGPLPLPLWTVRRVTFARRALLKALRTGVREGPSPTARTSNWSPNVPRVLLDFTALAVHRRSVARASLGTTAPVKLQHLPPSHALLERIRLLLTWWTLLSVLIVPRALTVLGV